MSRRETLVESERILPQGSAHAGHHLLTTKVVCKSEKELTPSEKRDPRHLGAPNTLPTPARQVPGGRDHPECRLSKPTLSLLSKRDLNCSTAAVLRVRHSWILRTRTPCAGASLRLEAPNVQPRAATAGPHLEAKRHVVLSLMKLPVWPDSMGCQPRIT